MPLYERRERNPRAKPIEVRHKAVAEKEQRGGWLSIAAWSLAVAASAYCIVAAILYTISLF